MLPVRVAFLFSFVILSSACGYHLRGSGVSVSGNLKSVYLEGGSGPLRDQFIQILKSSQTKFANSATDTDLVIKIVNDNILRRGLSLSERGRSNEFEIKYRVEYEVQKSGKILLASQPLEIRREYFNDQSDIIAKDNEEKVITNEMYQQAARSVISRVGSLLDAKPK